MRKVTLGRILAPWRVVATVSQWRGLRRAVLGGHRAAAAL